MKQFSFTERKPVTIFLIQFYIVYQIIFTLLILYPLRNQLVALIIGGVSILFLIIILLLIKNKSKAVIPIYITCFFVDLIYKGIISNERLEVFTLTNVELYAFFFQNALTFLIIPLFFTKTSRRYFYSKRMVLTHEDANYQFMKEHEDKLIRIAHVGVNDNSDFFFVKKNKFEVVTFLLNLKGSTTESEFSNTVSSGTDIFCTVSELEKLSYYYPRDQYILTLNMA